MPRSSQRGQLVDAFLPDHGAVHIGQQQTLAPPLGRLHRHVDAHALQILPDLPAVFGHLGHAELGRDAQIQPARFTAAPGVAQRFDQRGFQDRPGGIGQQGDDMGMGHVGSSVQRRAAATRACRRAARRAISRG